jgi:putative ABC transport system permease protein
MTRVETLRIALRAVRRNTLRSTLTTLGIVIGVASVIAVVALGESASVRVSGEMSTLGTNVLIIGPGTERRGPVSLSAPAFDNGDVRLLLHEVPDLAAIAPVASKSVLAVFGNANYGTVASGSTNDFFLVRNFRVAFGRGFSDADLAGGAAVCILGATVSRQLFGFSDPVGEVIRVGKVACRVIGVLGAKGQSSFGQDQDDLLVMPIRTVQRRMIGSTDIGTMFATVAEPSVVARVKRQVEAVLRERRHIQPGQRDDFSVEDSREIARTARNVTETLTALLGAVAGVSLLVGGIGIMNIMLLSVTERTREIGVRLAIGALGREILQQFLVESMLLCLIGGMIGILVGLAGSLAVSRVLSFPFVIDPLLIAIAFASSAAFGITFGFIPARKAAALNPIEALRHE